MRKRKTGNGDWGLWNGERGMKKRKKKKNKKQFRKNFYSGTLRIM